MQNSQRIVLICSAVLFLPLATWSQSPPPSESTKRNKPETTAKKSQDYSDKYKNPVDSSPASGPSENKEKTNQGTTENQDQSPSNWWMVKLTGLIALIYLAQLVVFGLQARRLKQTVEKMDEIARGQSADIQASITQATRAAVAMEGVAISMAENAESMRLGVAINREIADRQKIVTELQSRAYLVVLFDGMVVQNPQTGVRFEPKLKLINQGNTPAKNIRFAAFSDVTAFPIRDDFPFSVPQVLPSYSTTIGPHLHKIISGVVPKMYNTTEAYQLTQGVGQRIISWGIVKYQDAFDVERFVKFGFTFFLMSKENWFSADTEKHNDSN
ncbi:MAG TPA: hypothetical protein VKT49_04045 [Bryobacteraceae bacterium]|nr:hypothetical protein [Bryobacteraceae bacterium]